MLVKELIEKLNLKVVAGESALDNEILSGFVGDLLSVVMGKATKGCAWITIQSHFNIVAVATLIDVACIIVTEEFEVEESAIEKANDEDIPILVSNLSSYQIASQLSNLGIQ